MFDQWKETNWSISWSYENYVQIKSLNRVRDIRDQLAALCERVEILPESNATGSIEPIQKSLLGGYFMNTVRSLFVSTLALVSEFNSSPLYRPDSVKEVTRTGL